MKQYAHIILRVLCVLCPHVAAARDVYISYGTDYTDSIVADDDSVTIINHGNLSGNVTLNTRHTITIYNYGDITGNFSCGEYCAYITHEIHGDGDINPIPNLSGHVVYAHNDNDENIDINMADLIGVANNAYEIQLANANFIIGANVPYFPNQISIEDDGVVFIINDISGDLSQPLISNVITHGNVFHTRFSDDIDTMFNPEYEWKDNALYVTLSREMNYSIVLGGDIGNYLDSLREKNPNDKLIVALDGATNRDSISRILSESGRINPINLMKPVITFNTHNVQDYIYGTTITPFYIYASDFSVVGGHLNIAGGITNNLSGNIGIVGGHINYAADLDEYSGMLYGGNIGVRYADDEYCLDTHGAFLYVSFDDLDVFDNGNIINNPNGIGINLVSDLGLNYKIYNDIDLMPFVGGRLDYVSIANQNDMDFNLRVGAKIEKTENTDGNVYSVGGRVLVETSGTVYGGMYMKMLSVADAVGGGIEIGAAYDDMGFSVKFLLNGTIVF